MALIWPLPRSRRARRDDEPGHCGSIDGRRPRAVSLPPTRVAGTVGGAPNQERRPHRAPDRAGYWSSETRGCRPGSLASLRLTGVLRHHFRNTADGARDSRSLLPGTAPTVTDRPLQEAPVT